VPLDAGQPCGVVPQLLGSFRQRGHKFLQTDRDKQYRIETAAEYDGKLPTIENILEGMPKKQLPLAKLMFDFISRQQNIKVENNGQLIVNGPTIKNSNITDLIHDLSRDRKTHPAPPVINPFLRHYDKQIYLWNILVIKIDYIIFNKNPNHQLLDNCLKTQINSLPLLQLQCDHHL